MKNNFFVYNQKPDTEIQHEEDILVFEEELHNIILYNDDVNTFEFVINTLIEVCNHNVIQAEQCTYLVHYTGKCAVKRGTYKKLLPICEALLERGLTATIE
jgi:ATP-dependent Clp protease adaptor protein ClpS